MYDLMEDAGIRLSGELLGRARNTVGAESEWLREEHARVIEEMREVDATSRAAVEAKTEDFRRRLRDLLSPS